MAGSLQFTPQQFADAAHKWRSDLLMLPIIGIQDTLQYMTGRPGIRYKESVGTITGDAQFAPYNATRRSNFNLNVDYRTLETFFGSVVADFEPNTAVSTLLGAVGATKGDGQAQTPTAQAVLALVAKGLSGHLNDAIWSAKRNANGLTSADLFNGFDTITDDEIAGGGLSVAKGNYAQLSQSLTAQNAVDSRKKCSSRSTPISALKTSTCTAARNSLTSTTRLICLLTPECLTTTTMTRLLSKAAWDDLSSFLSLTRLTLSTSTSLQRTTCS